MNLASLYLDGEKVAGSTLEDFKLLEREARFLARRTGKRAEVIDMHGVRVACVMPPAAYDSPAGQIDRWIGRALKESETQVGAQWHPCPAARLDQAKGIEDAARHFGVSVEAVVRVALEVGLSRLGVDA